MEVSAKANANAKANAPYFLYSLYTKNANAKAINNY